MVVQTIDLRPKYVPTPRQAPAHSCQERYALFGGAVGGGKSAWLCNEAIQLSLDYPGNRGYLCRHELTSFRRTTLLTLQGFLPDSLISVHHKSEGYYDLVNGSRIYYGGLGDEHGLERLKSMDLGWAGIDQCEETSEGHFFMLASRLRLILPDGSTPLYKLLCTANPDPGWPRQRWIEQKLPDHIFIPALPADNPYLPDDYEANLRVLYPADLAQALLDGDWDVITGVDYLIPYRDINAAIDRQLEAEDDDLGSFGIDVARYGDDKTVVLYRVGPVVRQIWQWGKMDIVQTEKRVKVLIDEFEPDFVNVDVIGLGAGLYDNLCHREDYSARPVFNGVNVARSAHKSKRYINRRAEAYSALAARMRDGHLDLPNDSELRAQLSAIRFEITPRGLKIEAKETMKRRGLPSPDKADALMLTETGSDEPLLRWL